MKLVVHVDSQRLIRRLLSPLLLLVLLTLAVKSFSDAFLQPTMRAVEGVQNLKDWSVERSGRMKLAGDWSFYPNQFLSPESITFDSLATSPGWLTLPGTWNDQEIDGESLSGFGYATLALHVELPDAGDYLLKIPTLTNSYRLWINGETKIDNPALDNFIPNPRHESSTRFVRFHAPEAKALIVFHVSNYQHRAGGIWEPIHLASSGHLTSLHALPIARDLIIALVLLVTAMVALVMGIRRQKPALIYLALFAVLMLLRSLTVNERILFQILEIYDWQWQQRLEHLILYASLPLFGFYLWRRDPITLPDWLMLMTAAVTCSLILIVFTTEAAVFTHTTRIFQLLGILLAFITIGLAIELVSQRQVGGLRFFISVVILMLTGLNDILYDHHQIESIYLMHVGGLIFVVLQLLMPKDAQNLNVARRPELQSENAPTLSIHNASLTPANAPTIIADAMQTALTLWQQHTGTDKLELAEKSQQWRVTNDNGCLKTRTMDKYLKPSTVPLRPRLNPVMRTLDYVASMPNISDHEQRRLTEAKQAIERLQHELHQ